MIIPAQLSVFDLYALPGLFSRKTVACKTGIESALLDDDATDALLL
jgi:hypothetical protein